MAVFDSDDQLYDVLQGVFERLSTDQAVVDKFSKSNIVIRIHLTDPVAQVTLVGRNGEARVVYGPSQERANMKVAMSADLLHRIWMGDESLSQAFFNGHIKTSGNYIKAMKTVEIFKECERVYPMVAAEHNLV